MSLYTKTGDGGETSLYGGTRVRKDDVRVWAYGTIDEANSVLGVIYSVLEFSELKKIVRSIQKKMFVLGARIASDEKGLESLKEGISADDIAYLEEIIDDYTAKYGKSSGFIIPGETKASALFHVARTVVRRAERHVTELASISFVPANDLKYLNRLSDALFVLAKLEIIDSFVKKVAERINEIISQEGESNLTKNLCEKMYDAALDVSKRIGVPVCFAVTDAHGTLIYFRRETGSLLVSVGIAQKKAYTSATLKMPTARLGAMAQPGEPLYGINTADNNLVIFGGGFPLFIEGKIIGAIGVSGGSVEEDEQIGEAAAAVFKKLASKGGCDLG